MSDILLWLSVHKVPIFCGFALLMWSSGVLLYFWPSFKLYRFRGERHSWDVDLVQKQTYRNNRLEKRRG